MAYYTIVYSVIVHEKAYIMISYNVTYDITRYNLILHDIVGLGLLVGAPQWASLDSFIPNHQRKLNAGVGAPLHSSEAAGYRSHQPHPIGVGIELGFSHLKPGRSSGCGFTAWELWGSKRY